MKRKFLLILSLVLLIQFSNARNKCSINSLRQIFLLVLDTCYNYHDPTHHFIVLSRTIHFQDILAPIKILKDSSFFENFKSIDSIVLDKNSYHNFKKIFKPVNDKILVKDTLLKKWNSYTYSRFNIFKIYFSTLYFFGKNKDYCTLWVGDNTNGESMVLLRKVKGKWEWVKYLAVEYY